jgi:hypothetical protein
LETRRRRGDLFQKRRLRAEAWATFYHGGDGGKVIELKLAAH